MCKSMEKKRKSKKKVCGRKVIKKRKKGREK